LVEYFIGDHYRFNTVIKVDGVTVYSNMAHGNWFNYVIEGITLEFYNTVDFTFEVKFSGKTQHSINSWSGDFLHSISGTTHQDVVVFWDFRIPTITLEAQY
jgi:hypothetical protein